MNRTAVLNVAGLTDALIGEHTPRIREFAERGGKSVIAPVFPALTCTAQSTYLTGVTPSQHGVVGNGWYDRDLAEVQFWKQSNHLVRGRKLWEAAREQNPDFTCAKLFWWYNMYSSADFSVTPRPMYPADGRKVFDIYTWPYLIREDIKKDLGEFPFPCFWGPAAGAASPQGTAEAASRWIANSAKWIEERYHPGLSLVYLPHLDYNLQRHGTYERDDLNTTRTLNPLILPDLQAIDNIVGDLIDFFKSADVSVVLLSEYGITNVVRPIHINLLFRNEGWLTLKDELGRELLDCGASKVFAVADHQVAHVYLNDHSIENRVRSILEGTQGIARVLSSKDQSVEGINHPRSGDLIAIARDNAWFTYYYWLEDHRAPDFARTVDIHRKPGYDPAELFVDPGIRAPKLRIAWRLLQKRLGFRMLMDVIPLDATLVGGSHGCRPISKSDWPVLITQHPSFLAGSQVDATTVHNTLLRHIVD